MLKFRELRADELQIRPTDTNQQGRATLLTYKDARCDMRILDETVGPYGWSKAFKDINGVTYCGVALKDPASGVWIWKWDCGQDDGTDANSVKGTASDAFKRVCFNWNIGRALYTCPKIRITCPDDYYYNGKMTMTFKVSEIGYEDGKVKDLVVVDRKGTVVFSYHNFKVDGGQPEQPKPSLPEEDKSLDWGARLRKWCGEMKDRTQDPDEHTRLLSYYYYVLPQTKRGEQYGVRALWRFFNDDLKSGKLAIDNSNPRHPQVIKKGGE